MKPTSTLLLAILILFQSCYSYKKVEMKNLKIDTSKEYKIIISKKKSYTGKIIKSSKDSLVITSSTINYNIPKSSIKKMEEITYSQKKTTILIVVSLAVSLVAYAIHSLSNLKIEFPRLY